MLQLVRLVVDDAWTAPGAAARLRERVPNDAVLRRVGAKVSSALAEQASVVGDRAAVTVELALSLGPPGVVNPTIPGQFIERPAVIDSGQVAAPTSSLMPRPNGD